MKQITRGSCFEYLKAGRWNDLIEFLRSWITTHCPRYRRDEIELEVGTVVCRWALVQHQVAQPGYFDGYRKPSIGSLEQQDTELRREIDTWASNVLPTYDRCCARWDLSERAEYKLARVLKNIEAVKGGAK